MEGGADDGEEGLQVLPADRVLEEVGSEDACKIETEERWSEGEGRRTGVGCGKE